VDRRLVKELRNGAEAQLQTGSSEGRSTPTSEDWRGGHILPPG